MLPINVPQAKPGSGPAVAPQGQPGNAAAAMLKVKNAGALINEALPAVPMGSEFHTELLKVATTLNKILAKVPEQPGAQATDMMQQARQMSQQNPMMAALAKMFPPGTPPGGGAPGAPPGGAPVPGAPSAPPPPGAAGPA